MLQEFRLQLRRGTRRVLSADGAEHRERVRAEWADAGGALAPAYAVVIFDHAIDALYDWIGLGPAYRTATGCSTFTLETHLSQDRPVLAGEDVLVRNRILAVDAKRMHVAQEMFRPGQERRAAVMEQLSIHVDLQARRSAPFPPDRLGVIREAIDLLSAAPAPAGIGNAVSFAT